MIGDLERAETSSSKPKRVPPWASLIIPTLNEARALPLTLLELEKTLEQTGHDPSCYEILVMDGGSTDGTHKVVSRLAAGSRLMLSLSPATDPPEGLSASVMRGLRLAAAHRCLVMDGDGSHPPGMVPRLLATLDEGADFAIANRFHRRSSMPGLSFPRLQLARLCAWLSRPYIGLQDPLSGFAAMDLSRVRLPDRPPSGFKVIAELIRYNKGVRVVELPFDFQPRSGGVSKFDLTVAYHFAHQWLGWALSGKGSRQLGPV